MALANVAQLRRPNFESEFQRIAATSADTGAPVVAFRKPICFGRRHWGFFLRTQNAFKEPVLALPKQHNHRWHKISLLQRELLMDIQYTEDP